MHTCVCCIPGEVVDDGLVVLETWNVTVTECKVDTGDSTVDGVGVMVVDEAIVNWNSIESHQLHAYYYSI